MSPNILTIQPSDESLIQNLTSVNLISITDEIDLPTNISLPLVQTESGGIYVTQRFAPPLSMFKVYVNGFDSSGNPLKHLLSTAIKAIQPGEFIVSNYHH